MTFGGVPDPTYAGGFAGIGSTIGFTSAQITFGDPAASAFVIDNIAAVPEPGTLGLLALGVCAVGGRSRRRAAKA